VKKKRKRKKKMWMKKNPSLMKNGMDVEALQKDQKKIVVGDDDSLRDDDNESDV